MQYLIRTWAILVKELIQMRRDRMTFAMMIGIPIIQLVLFGYAINTDPKSLPTAIYAEENTEFTRAMLKGFENSGYYQFTQQVQSYQQAEAMLSRGEVSFVIYIPKGFTRQLVKQQMPQVLIEADASDPSASSNAISRVKDIIAQSIAPLSVGALSYLKQKPQAIDVVIHNKYNPENITQFNIVPGLLGVILTMTGVMITSMAMTRESEKGNLENILAMPAKPFEVMLGKILPYVLVGLVQTVVILLAAKYLFAVPFQGSFNLLVLAVLVFIIANLCLGFTFSTIAKTQMQAMQMTFFFFLPSILLSGFMFPFRGMPVWAQYIGEVLPLTHFLRIVRGIMLKGAPFAQLTHEFFAMLLFILVVGCLAILRYRRTLD
ncbi:ABC transporter permease [Thalassotalea marina]|uniref:Mannose-1-phosphate guanyltransferase n=1 Tax=Thalassotalea marina TaxID=1673741 RepID=A0A919BPD8_9GAMM|nr:ABC transporter permease [Thalassotalea marina]GHG00863.1 mannose-1-phosphate guanyltransferase [Thalassotalea marina]